MNDPGLTIYFTLLAFFGGACIGSFANVCIHRIPRGESVVRPRSRCPACGTLIAGYDNIPLVSYFLLRGRCRHCGAKISARYPLVELVMAVFFLALWNRYGFDLRTLIYMGLTTALVVATFIDLDFMIIPDRISLGGIPAGLLASAWVPMLHGASAWQPALWSSLWGAAVGAGSLYLVSVLGRLAFKKDAMGMGDVKLLGAIGAFVGWEGVVFTILLSSLLGSIIGMGLILARGKEWQSRIPYGPYLAVAALVWILGGSAWWQLYLSWIGAA
ncbi:MAG: prepilin peptidase [Kiritimatiellae bacterium]|nr:prepilin peptidase [Kiritimatiellia bacterium]MCO5060482.1 prepilin peptidase [Kiritimatiellia bacterium]MCO6400679.1 prepilin peptidase [Verrucomicrobiota bacterium]